MEIASKRKVGFWRMPVGWCSGARRLTSLTSRCGRPATQERPTS